MRKPVALILCGDGVNCERETARAFELAGAEAQIKHVNDIMENPKLLEDFQFLALPGGFSFGDELGSGRVLSLKIKYGLGEHFNRFLEAKRPVVGICNGFQVLVKMGLLPWKERKQTVTLAHNDHGNFIDRWVDLKVHTNRGPWLSQYKLGEKLSLPIRHGEGRILTNVDHNSLLKELKEKKQVAFRYEEDVNGSLDNIAGLIDETGFVLGMMPHPEAYVRQATLGETGLDPHAEGDGLKLFKNAVQYMKNS